jgi:hypothetical protein
MLMMGEVHTGLLRCLGELSETECREVLSLISGERARISQRPLPYAVSPELLTGVDCRLPSASNARIRGIGTVAHRAVIVGGRVLQASSYAVVEPARADNRASWSHYLARPGVVEVLGRQRRADMAEGLTARELPMDCLNLGAISGRLMNAVQDAPQLDRKPPFKSARTQLRWVLEAGDGPRDLRLTLGRGSLRTLRVAGEFTSEVVAFCEDLALHDWLLTTLQAIIQRALIGISSPAQIATRLSPAIDHLLHLWMPAVRVDDAFHPLWEDLERKPGFTRQWKASVERIRDQIAVNTLLLLSVTPETGRERDGAVPQPRPEAPPRSS